MGGDKYRKDQRKKNAMEELLGRIDESVYEVDNPLARIWRIILAHEGLEGKDWHRKITRYQNRISRISSQKGIANMKGNLTRRLTEKRLSFGLFLHGLSIMEYRKIRFEVHLWKQHSRDPFIIGINLTNDELIHEAETEEHQQENQEE